MAKFVLNLVLLPKQVTQAKWSISDPRAVHILEVLKVGLGDEIDFAVENGPLGKGKLETLGDEFLELSFKWESLANKDFLPVCLLIGLSRPQTCRKILDQGSTMGVQEFHFFGTDRGEPSYASSPLWTTDEWKVRIRKGVEQAFSSFMPTCMLHQDLKSVLGNLTTKKKSLRIGLDNYEGTSRFGTDLLSPVETVELAVGAERGWSRQERNLLRENGFKLQHLGERVLRVETAVVAALGVLGAVS
ncbi:MAG: hypothetical protein CBC16_04835 [Verrucomicrobia bacterium TMED56]|nr:MAG: hypothetical protein CBC16_04835 [Verrucomicrobia bacterium TMED56]